MNQSTYDDCPNQLFLRMPVLMPSGFRVAIAGLAALAVAMGVGRFAFTPLLPMMQQDSGLSVADGGWLASANYLGYLLGALSALAVRVPVAAAIRGGLVVISLATLAMGFEHRFPAWMALRFLAGVANAWVGIFVMGWCLERLAPLNRPLLNGLVFAGVGAGIMGVGGLCMALMRAAVGSSESWIVLGIASLVVAAAVWATFGIDGGASSRNTGQSGESALGWNGESTRLVLCFGASGFGYIIPATYLPAMARQAIHDPAVFGWAWPAFGAAAMASTVAAAVRSGAIGNRRVWIASQLTMAFGVALPVIWPGIAAIMFAALFVGGTFMVITMVSMQEARAIGSRNPTGLIAAMTAAFAFGQIAGPISVSYTIGADGNFTIALLVASFLLVAGACGLSRTRPPLHPAGPQLTKGRRNEALP
jgi:predicted MFS family arabinose efflux permease